MLTRRIGSFHPCTEVVEELTRKPFILSSFIVELPCDFILGVAEDNSDCGLSISGEAVEFVPESLDVVLGIANDDVFSVEMFLHVRSE